MLMIERPNCRLGAIACANLAKDGFHVGLYGWLRDFEKPCYVLVRVTLNKPLEDRGLSRRQVVCWMLLFPSFESRFSECRFSLNFNQGF